MHTCVGGREEKHQPSRMFLVCQTQCQPGGGSQLPPRYSSPVTGPGPSASNWHLGCEERRGGWDVVLCQWDSDSPAPWGSPLEHQKGSGRAPPGWSHREDTAESLPTWPQIPLEDGPWTLLPHSKWENKRPYSKGFFLPVNFSLLGWN